ncbi:unnamed protein product [Lactuca saligna]|uniref:Chloride channel protein n=1 Tax=Lactuca saligna TaxID=75948 RepID=A0AA35YVC1_LACSI|nr:unnamed protein product [Lactuca saligna]
MEEAPELLVIYHTLNLSTLKADLEGIAMNTNQSLLGQLLMHAHKVFDIMSMLAFHSDETNFGYLSCRYAPKGLENKIIELQDLEFRFSFTTKSMFICDGWLAAIQLVNNLIKDGLTTKAGTLFVMLLKLGIFKRTCLLMRWPMLMLKSLVQRLNENLIRTQVLWVSHLQLQLNLESSMVCNPSGLDTEEPLPVAVFDLTTCELGSLITHVLKNHPISTSPPPAIGLQNPYNPRTSHVISMITRKDLIFEDSTTPESDQGQIAAQDTAETSVMFYGLAVVTFGTAVPAGQFVPGIMIGSTYGHLVGRFVVRLYEKLNIEKGIYALLGAASFLGGSMRMAVSLCVIMVEITNNLNLLPLIMLVLLISKSKVDFQHSPSSRHSLSDFVKPISSKGLSISDIHLTPDDLEALEETRLKQN